MNRTHVLPALLLAGAAAHAQTPTFAYEFQIGQHTLLPGETTTVTVRVHFTPGLGEPITSPAGTAPVHGASRGAFDVHADGGVWTNLTGLPAYNFIGTNPGTITGSSVHAVTWGTGFGPPLLPLPSPAAVWRATFTAPADLGPIELNAAPFGDHGVWAWNGVTPPVFEVLSQQTTGGQAVINVVPAPASLALLAAGVFAATRRRRSGP